METIEGAKMKFEILSPEDGNGDPEGPEELLERSVVAIMGEFADLKEKDRWKKRRSPVKKEKIITEKKAKEAVIELPKDPESIAPKPHRSVQTTTLSEWILSLEPSEQAYARECFHFWEGTSGDRAPCPPRGMSKAKADILLYHVKSLNNGETGRRKVEAARGHTFRWKESYHRQLALEASTLDICLSEYVMRCLNAGRPLVQAYPKLGRFFEDAGPEKR